jgi:hypothetical protein
MKNITILLLMFYSVLSFGQNEIGINLPDTIKFESLEYRIINNLKEFKITDTLAFPEAYIVNIEYQNYFIAIKTKQGFKLIPIVDADKIWVSQEDLDGKRSKELVVKWQNYSGHSGWENSIHERQGGVIIYDLDRMLKLGSFDTYLSHQQWWSEWSGPDSLPYEERETISSGSDYSCVAYELKVEKNIIKIWQTNVCPDQGDTKYPIVDTGIHRYIYRKGYLLRIK